MMTLPRIAAGLIAITGAIHLVLSPEYLEEEPYLGVLFILGAAACALVAVGLWRNGGDRRMWALGSLVALGMAVGFILSRTTGLPGFKEEEWQPIGLCPVRLEVASARIAARGPTARDARREPARGY